MNAPRPIAFFDMKAQQTLIRAEIDAGIARILDHGRFIQGPEVDALEAQLAAFAGAKHAVGVSSGTDALQIAMMAEGIGRGDAVFLPAFTYTATAEVPLVLGATPVFVDVDPVTFNIDIADLKRRVAAVAAEGRLRPRAVIGVDLYGLPADWPAMASQRIFPAASREPRSTPPAISPRIIVPRVGMKLSVGYPPSFTSHGLARGNQFRITRSAAQAKLLFFCQWAANPDNPCSFSQSADTATAP